MSELARPASNLGLSHSAAPVARVDVMRGHGPWSAGVQVPVSSTNGSSRSAALQARVLIVVPDITLAASLACRLDALGFEAKVAPTARSARRLLDIWPSDAVIVDLDIDGFSAHELITAGPDDPGPVTVLLRQTDDPAERVYWLKAGASDFVPAPAWPEEVVARVESVLRRQTATDTQWTTRVGPVCINDTTGEVEVAGRRHILSPMELKLFRHLASSPGTVFTRPELLRDVWGYTTGGDATVTVHIRKLREKIERNSKQPRLLRTRHGIGYYLSLDDLA